MVTASLSTELAKILDSSYDSDRSTDRVPDHLRPYLPFPKQPKPSQLEKRFTKFFSDCETTTDLIPEMVRAVGITWEAYAEGSGVAPADFLISPIGGPYRVAEIPGKGRAMLASRDLHAGEVVLMESPLILLVKDKLHLHMFFALPKRAIHAMLLLHNNIPDRREFSNIQDIPHHRLLDYLKGVATTNAFSETVKVDGTEAGLIVLVGSLFNHSNEANVHRAFDISSFKMAFTVVTAVKAGDELTVSYNHTGQQLKDNYGIRT